MDIFHIHFHHLLEEELKKQELKILQRNLRDSSNPFEMPENSFRKLYRLPNTLVRDYLIPLIEPHMQVGERSTYVPLHIKMLTTLHLLAQGSYQSVCGNDFIISVGQSTASKIICEILEIFTTHLFPRHVRFPTQQREIHDIKNGFLQKFNFPNVIGAIDCTHVALIAPAENDAMHPALAYYNRKGFYSINVQAVCDSNLKFLAVNARFPGATHDAAIWSNSTINRHLRRKFEEGDETWLLGDSGYPLSPWLMTPINDVAENTPEGRYTAKHMTVRNTIERSFGVLKQRFRCLMKHRVLHYSHRKAGLIVYACVTLHNIMVEHNIYDDVDEEEVGDVAYVVEDADANPIQPDVLAAGRRIRNRLVAILDTL